MARLEDFIQFKCADYLRKEGILFFHVPNAGRRTPREACRLKALGMVSGVHDLVILLDNGVVLFVELKTTKGSLNPAQVIWHNKFKTVSGHRSHLLVADTPQEAIQQLAALLKNHS